MRTNEPLGAREATTDDVTVVELVVGGMHCASCALLIEEVLADDPAVARAAVDLDAARAVIAYDPSTTTVDRLCQAVVHAGYTATPAPLRDGTP